MLLNPKKLIVRLLASLLRWLISPSKEERLRRANEAGVILTEQNLRLFCNRYGFRLVRLEADFKDLKVKIYVKKGFLNKSFLTMVSDWDAFFKPCGFDSEFILMR